MSAHTDLLDLADEVLDGSIELGSRSARTAALLARCAFEDWLAGQSALWVISVGRRPSSESQLVILRALRGDYLGETAMRVWDGLSRACHHHAYELQPSAVEVAHLIGEVRGLRAHP